MDAYQLKANYAVCNVLNEGLNVMTSDGLSSVRTGSYEQVVKITDFELKMILVNKSCSPGKRFSTKMY